MKRIAYISGPMSGIVGYNYKAFNAAAKELRGRGWRVINPVELDARTKKKALVWEDYLRRDIPEVLKCDKVFVLPGWERSRGAKLEVLIAHSLKIPVVHYTGKGGKEGHTIPPPPAIESILHEAHQLVHHNRGKDYGHPLLDFDRTAKIWTAILDTPVTAEQVGLCMIGVKISRECNRPKRDNRMDIAGYAETLQMISDRRAEFSS